MRIAVALSTLNTGGFFEKKEGNRKRWRNDEEEKNGEESGVGLRERG